jgi:flagellar hook-length control protein FliK
MATTIFEALLPTNAPPRPAEPAAAGHDGPPFAPVLSQALHAESARPPSDQGRAAAPAEDKPSGATAVPGGEHASDPAAAIESEAPADDQAAPAAVEASADDGEEARDDGGSDEATAADAAAGVAAASAQRAAEAVVTVTATGDEATPSVDAAPGDHDAETARGGSQSAGPRGEDGSEKPPTPEPRRELGDVAPAERRVIDQPGPVAPLKAAKEAPPRVRNEAGQDETVDAGAERTQPAATSDRPAKRVAPAAKQAATDGADHAPPAESEESAKSTPDKAAHVAAAEVEGEAVDDGQAKPELLSEGAGVGPVSHRAEAPAAAAAEATAGAAAPAAVAAAPVERFTGDEAPLESVTAAPAEAPPTRREGSALARLAAERSLQPGGAAPPDDGASAAERGRFVGRVEGAIRAAHQRDGRVQVRLSPPELGALRIELTVHQGALSARLEAETPAARNLLLDNLPALRERLAQQEVRVERFDVDLRQETSGGGSGQNGAHERPARESHWRPGSPRSDRPRGAPAAPTVALRPGGAGASDAALDVRV